MTLQLHQPDGEGGLEPVPPAEADWRTQLRSFKRLMLFTSIPAASPSSRWKTLCSK